MPVVNPGIRRLLASAIQRLFNGASFSAPLTHSLVPERGTGSPTFTRATTATVKDHEGVLRTVPAGCARFEGARFVRNLQATSSEPASGWTAAGATPPTVTYTTLDGTGAVSMAFPVVAAGFANSRCTGPLTSVSWVQNSTKIATRLVASLSRPLTGTEALTLYLSGASALDDVFVFNASNTPTTATLQTAIDTFVNPSFTGTMGVIVYVTGDIVGSPVTLSLTRIQWQDITGRADQTTPSEYVSVGVTSSPYYHGAGVDGVKYFNTDLDGNTIAAATNTGYVDEGARTNLCLQSNAFTTTWTDGGAAARLKDATGPDGATSAWTLTDDSAVSTESRYQAITLTAADHVLSIFVGKTVGAQSSYPVLMLTHTGDAFRAIATIDTTNGVITPWTAVDGSTIVTSNGRCVSYNDDLWRAELTFTGTAAAWNLYIAPAATANASQSTGTFDATVTGSAVFYGAQVELGSFASSYIATTTVAVTRNADVEAVSTSGNIAAAAGSVYLEYTPTHTPSGTIALWGTYVDASNYTAILHDATNLIFRKRIAGVNYDATIANAFVSGTTYKACATWGTSGTSITLNGTEGTPHANTTAAQIGSTMQWGADGNSLQQPFANIRNCRDWLRQLSASERTAVTA